MDCVLFGFFRVVFLLHLFHSHKLQIQVVNQRPNLLVYLRGEVLRHGGEGGIGPGIGRAVPADEPVGNVDVVGPVLLGAVLLEEVGHFDAQLREFGGLLAFPPNATGFSGKSGSRYLPRRPSRMMGSKRVARKRVKSEGRSGLRVLATMYSGSVSTLSTGWTGGQGGRWWTDLLLS